MQLLQESLRVTVSEIKEPAEHAPATSNFPQ